MEKKGSPSGRHSQVETFIVSGQVDFSGNHHTQVEFTTRCIAQDFGQCVNMLAFLVLKKPMNASNYLDEVKRDYLSHLIYPPNQD